MRSAEKMREWAQGHRGKLTLSPDNPIVKAAKRYCMRMDEQERWDVGMAGHCLLGARALKQWLYELTDPVRRAWRSQQGRWLIVGLPILGLLLWGFFVSWRGTAILIAAVVGLALLGFWILCLPMGMEAAHAGLRDERWSWSKMKASDRVLVAFMYVVGAPFFWMGYLGVVVARRLPSVSYRTRQRVWLIVQRTLLGVLLLVLGYILVVIEGSWVMALSFVAIVVGMVSLLFSLATLALAGLDALKKHSVRKREQARIAVHHDEAAQARAREALIPSMKAWYEESYLGSSWVREPISFDAMVERIGQALEEHGDGWTDLLSPQYANVGERCDAFEYLRDVLEYGYWNLILALQLLVFGSRKVKRQQGWRGLRDIGEFISASWFLAKTRVCMMVDLPDWDEVKTDK